MTFRNKLSSEKAREIRREACHACGHVKSPKAIAKRYGVSVQTIRRILLGTTYKPELPRGKR